MHILLHLNYFRIISVALIKMKNATLYKKPGLLKMNTKKYKDIIIKVL